jgi:hypothetical protein
MIAPFAVQTAFDREVQADVLVTRYTDLTPKNLPVAPLLAVEVLSRGTALHDRNTKKAFYERIVVGDDAFDAELPFPVWVIPARLLDGLRP